MHVCLHLSRRRKFSVGGSGPYSRREQLKSSSYNLKAHAQFCSITRLGGLLGAPEQLRPILSLHYLVLLRIHLIGLLYEHF